MHPRNAHRAAALGGALLLAALGGAAAADGFRAVESAERFVALTEGRDLRRFGVRLSVLPDGRIEGRAFGARVTGTWTWQGDHFCREMSWSGDTIGHDCQQVERRGDTLRFTADRGAGDAAELTLR
jgi:hypothetical protein